ncbi:unnamed protein product [Protopolystoma xenopodis]|uniref:Uncharacterized protein n=1 Tax=Protopolystoma xenopodis TaxID=117903 RepID=A0A448XDG9_9PLAT|nr:unnamed protein product [Protopolystoma xenopodis]
MSDESVLGIASNRNVKRLSSTRLRDPPSCVTNGSVARGSRVQETGSGHPALRSQNPTASLSISRLVRTADKLAIHPTSA